ncbi:hypothetical protein ACLI4Z_13920 [Natrialbaceae archaeon A-arb3/5]
MTSNDLNVKRRNVLKTVAGSAAITASIGNVSAGDVQKPGAEQSGTQVKFIEAMLEYDIGNPNVDGNLAFNIACKDMNYRILDGTIYIDTRSIDVRTREIIENQEIIVYSDGFHAPDGKIFSPDRTRYLPVTASTPHSSQLVTLAETHQHPEINLSIGHDNTEGASSPVTISVGDETGTVDPGYEVVHALNAAEVTAVVERTSEPMTFDDVSPEEVTHDQLGVTVETAERPIAAVPNIITKNYGELKVIFVEDPLGSEEIWKKHE